eukprot:TRINITY_DN3005_c0_g1_i1.p1 TRINITY_DN3005_c0_g1~~TRINITY_DN3005_c0_g1_i1.p1  ORF type:complete len:344 (+),score=40.00 TRINITY_DN3005_c0_g1_i1:138-1169(+)
MFGGRINVRALPLKRGPCSSWTWMQGPQIRTRVTSRRCFGVHARSLFSTTTPSFKDDVPTARSTPSFKNDVPTASLLLIGNELLGGSVVDKNLPVVASLLHERGVSLIRCEIVRDVEEEICDSLERMCADSDIVISSGGIGSTHDDITYETLAKHFGTGLHVHQETVERMKDTSMVLTPARMRMATLPHDTCSFLFSPGLWVPLCVIQQLQVDRRKCEVWVLPGVPELFKRMLEAQQHHLPVASRRIVREALHTTLPEGDIADALREVQLLVQDNGIQIGSYPSFGLYNPVMDGQREEPQRLAEYSVRVVVEGRSADAVAETLRMLRDRVPDFALSVVDDETE